MGGDAGLRGGLDLARDGAGIGDWSGWLTRTGRRYSGECRAGAVKDVGSVRAIGQQLARGQYDTGGDMFRLRGVGAGGPHAQPSHSRRSRSSGSTSCPRPPPALRGRFPTVSVAPRRGHCSESRHVLNHTAAGHRPHATIAPVAAKRIAGSLAQPVERDLGVKARRTHGHVFSTRSGSDGNRRGPRHVVRDPVRGLL